MVTVLTEGGPVDNRTMAMLREVEKRCGFGITVVQGRNPGGVTASAGTHDGWGVVDIRLRDFNTAERQSVILNCRIVGFAAWLRTLAQGFTSYHCHAVAIGGEGIAPGALAQVQQYLSGTNGLASHGKDDGPRNFPGGPGIDWEDYLKSRGGITVSAESNIIAAVNTIGAAVNKNVDTFEAAEANRYQRLEAIHKEDMLAHGKLLAAITLLTEKLDAIVVK